MATYQACQTIGLPECRINLAVRPLSSRSSDRSNELIVCIPALCRLSRRSSEVDTVLHGIQAGKQECHEGDDLQLTGSCMQAEALIAQPPLPGVPLQIRNAPTKLMKKLGYGKEYSYNPAFAHPVTNVCPSPSSSEYSLILA